MSRTIDFAARLNPRLGRRRLLQTGIAGITMLGMGYQPARAAGNSSWDRIAETGVMRLGVLQNHEPYHNLEQGKWVGFAIDMGLDAMKAVGDEMKKPLKAEFVVTTVANLILDIQADKMDVYMGFTASEERERAITLFGPIYELPECAVNTKGFEPGDSWEAYNKPTVTIAVVMGSTDEQAAQKMLPKAKLRSLRSSADAILDVQSGNSQAMLNTLLSVMMAQKVTPNLANSVGLQPLLNQPSVGGTRRDGDGRLGTFLKEWAPKYRASGRTKEVILAAMKHSGLDISNLPSSLKF